LRSSLKLLLIEVKKRENLSESLILNFFGIRQIFKRVKNLKIIEKKSFNKFKFGSYVSINILKGDRFI